MLTAIAIKIEVVAVSRLWCRLLAVATIATVAMFSFAMLPRTARAADTGAITVDGTVATRYDAYQLFSATVIDDDDAGHKIATDVTWANGAVRQAVLPVLHDAGLDGSASAAQETAEWMNADGHMTTALTAKLARAICNADATSVALNAGTAAELPCGYWLIVADDDAIAASTWATAVKDAGVFKIGGVQTSTLFSLLNEKDGQTRGFDAGIAQLLSNYILGENKVEITQVTSDTRESVLQNGQVDAVFATYTITDERKKLVSFAGPYYYTQQAILVLADNDDIKSVDDLADKNVAVQSGSNGPAILEEFAPKASQQEFKTDEEARQALQQGRVDAYVIDNNMQQSALVREPGKYKIAGKSFGNKEPYGIGLPLDSDGVAFVNDFLKKIEDDGTWTELWQICIGDRTGDTNVPELPEIGA